MNEQINQWHQMSGEEAVRQQKSNASCGLSRKEARSRFHKAGANKLFDQPRKPMWLMKRLLTEPSLLLFIAVTLLTVCFSDLASAIPTLIMLILWAIPIAGILVRLYLQRERLRRAKIPSVTVLRENTLFKVSARVTVPGDILFLRAGDIVPGDCRLLISEHLRVRLPAPSLSGNEYEHAISVKQAQTIYQHGAEIHAPAYENMIYGGSEVLSGTAKAIVVAIGSNTYLGAMKERPVPDPVTDDLKSLAGLYPFLRLFGFAMLAWLLPFSIIALLNSPESMTSTRVFLPACLLTASASAAVSYLYFHVLIRSEHLKRHGRNSENASETVCTSAAVDGLPDVTDLVLMGHGVVSDCLLHFAGACNGEQIIMPDSGERPELQPLCEAIQLLQTAQAKLPVRGETVSTESETVLRELISLSRFDTEALRVRLTNVSFVREDAGLTLKVQTRNEEFRLRFSRDIQQISSCSGYEIWDGTVLPFRERSYEKLQNFFAFSAKNGDRILTVVKETAYYKALIGVIAMREHVWEDVPQAVEKLKQMGVRIHWFLRSRGILETAFAHRCGFAPEEVLTAEESVCLADEINRYHMFIGFPGKQITTAVCELKKQGRCVAVLTGSAPDMGIFSLASVRIACDRFADDGCAQTIMRDADLFIPPAATATGGLDAIAMTIASVRKRRLRVKALLRILTSFQILRVLTVSLGILIGMGPIPAPALFYTSFFMDLAAFLYVSHTDIAPKFLQAPIQMQIRNVSAFFRNRHLWMVPAIPAAAMLLLFVLLRAFGLLQAAHGHALLFVAMLLMQTVLMLFGKGNGILRLPPARVLVCLFLFLLLPALTVILLSVLIPAVAVFTELGSWNATSVILLLISPLLTLGSVLLFSGTAE